MEREFNTNLLVKMIGKSYFKGYFLKSEMPPVSELPTIVLFSTGLLVIARYVVLGRNY